MTLFSLPLGSQGLRPQVRGAVRGEAELGASGGRLGRDGESDAVESARFGELSGGARTQT